MLGDVFFFLFNVKGKRDFRYILPIWKGRAACGKLIAKLPSDFMD